MVENIHRHGLRAAWYFNGCKCGEQTEVIRNYAGDVRSLHTFGFDAVKIDGCGQQLNMTLYAQLMKESGRNYVGYPSFCLLSVIVVIALLSS